MTALSRSDLSLGGLTAIEMVAARDTISRLMRVTSAADGKVQLRLTQGAGPMSSSEVPGTGNAVSDSFPLIQINIM